MIMSYSAIVRSFAQQYKKIAFKGVQDKKINANYYWIKHKLNLLEMNKLLQVVSFDDKFALVKAIQNAEAKVAYWERHKNFKFADALEVYTIAKKIPHKPRVDNFLKIVT